MNVTTTPKSRLEDWQDRQQYLAALAGSNCHRIAQIKVLDYLISNYRNSPAAHRPARFAFRRDLYWNDRRIIVHHHLSRGSVAGVESHQEAEQRIADLVQRMNSHECHEDEGFTPTKFTQKRRRPVRFLNPDWLIKLGFKADIVIRHALTRSPVLTETCLKHLVCRLTDVAQEDTKALDLFLKCKNRNILECTVRAWRDRVSQGKSAGKIIEALETIIRCPNNQPRASELIRTRLADDDSQVRVAASHLIADIGSLDDIGLLSDLLSLPQSNDEAWNERDAIAAAMQSIAGRNVS